MSPEIILTGPDLVLATWGSLVMSVTDGPLAFTATEARRVVTEITRLRRTTHRDRLVYLYVAGARSAIPDDEARRASAPIADLIDESVGVHEGDGFRASLTRAVVTGIGMLSKGRARPVIVATLAEAALELSKRMPESEPEIAAALHTIRAAVRS